jgi:hypothetical protein
MLERCPIPPQTSRIVISHFQLSSFLTLSLSLSIPKQNSVINRFIINNFFLYILIKFRSYGFHVQLIRERATRNPLIFGRLGYDNNKPTVTFYGHYDVFPVNNDGWISDPFTMMGKNGYLYGRGTSDDKGPILTILFAAVELLVCISNLMEI